MYIYALVEESLYNRRLVGHYKSVAYQAISTTLRKGCSSGFVHWFPVGYFLQPRIFTCMDPKVDVRVPGLTTTALWEVIGVNLDT